MVFLYKDSIKLLFTMSIKNENWKFVIVNGKKTDLPLVVSNKGFYGIKKPNGDIDVRVKKIKNGNVRHRLKIGGKEHTLSLANMVANAFIKKTSPKQLMVVHLDYDYTNNNADNLKWVTIKDHKTHSNNSPKTLLARQKKAFTKSAHGHILNEKSVTELKKMIWDPKRKLSFSQLAEKFGVSQMQIYRLKSGEIWFHIKVENEPLSARYEQNLKNIAYQENVKLKEQELKNRNKKEKDLELKIRKEAFKNELKLKIEKKKISDKKKKEELRLKKEKLKQKKIASKTKQKEKKLKKGKRKKKKIVKKDKKVKYNLIKLTKKKNSK